jgi:hypothetical protein
MDVATLAARILMSAIFLWGGYGKLMQPTATMHGFASTYPLPVPSAAYVIAVCVEAGGGVLRRAQGASLLSRPCELHDLRTYRRAGAGGG